MGALPGDVSRCRTRRMVVHCERRGALGHLAPAQRPARGVDPRDRARRAGRHRTGRGRPCRGAHRRGGRSDVHRRLVVATVHRLGIGDDPHRLASRARRTGPRHHGLHARCDGARARRRAGHARHRPDATSCPGREPGCRSLRARRRRSARDRTPRRSRHVTDPMDDGSRDGRRRRDRRLGTQPPPALRPQRLPGRLPGRPRHTGRAARRSHPRTRGQWTHQDRTPRADDGDGGSPRSHPVVGRHPDRDGAARSPAAPRRRCRRHRRHHRRKRRRTAATRHPVVRVGHELRRALGGGEDRARPGRRGAPGPHLLG